VGPDAHCQTGGCRLKKSEEGRKVATPVSVGTTAGSGGLCRGHYARTTRDAALAADRPALRYVFGSARSDGRTLES
jgi:hypothetical protein